MPLGKDGDRYRLPPAASGRTTSSLARNGLLYVSDWAGRAVLVVDPDDAPRRSAAIPVGEHPNQMALHPKDDRLFVACASSNCVSVIDTKRGHRHRDDLHRPVPAGPRRQHARRPGRRARRRDALRRQRRQQLRRRHRHRRAEPEPGEGLHPDRLVSDGRRRHARRQEAARRRRQGQPDAAQPARRREARTQPWPGPTSEGGYRRIPFPYIGTTLSGALSIVADARREAARRNTPTRSTATARTPTSCSPPPRTSGRRRSRPRSATRRPIKHVIYIIKENRTYDQVFGDMPRRATATRSLVMFGEEVTPNHHKLAEEFVLLDNLYCNGQVSPRRPPRGRRWPTTPTTSPATGT